MDDLSDQGDDQMIVDEQKVLRPYQEALVERCMEHNTIVLLPTGTGKTLIAFTVIMNCADEIKGSYPAVAKRSVFLTPTKVLLEQQHREFQKHCNDPAIKSVIRHGDHQVDDYKQKEWNELFQKYQVFFFTPQVFSDMLTKNFVSFNNINLVIIDECHHASRKKGQSNSPYSIILEVYKAHKSTAKIVGLSASLFNSIKPREFDDKLQEMREIFQAEIYSDDSSTFSKDAKTFVVPTYNRQFESDIENDLESDGNESFLKYLSDTKANLNQAGDEDCEKLVQTLEKVEKINSSMGPWFAIETLNLIVARLENTASQMNNIIKVFILRLKEKLISIFRKPSWTNQDFCRKSPIHDKVTILMKILSSFPVGTPCIVFVTERVIANILYRYIKFLSENFDAFKRFKPGFFIGRNNAGTDRTLKFDPNSPNIKAAFEREELNLMIATSVLEEGIDVPSCKVVVRFDFPMNFRAYLQSRGRARHTESAYFLMADLKNSKAQQLLTVYRYIEDRLKNYLPSPGNAIPVSNADFRQMKYITTAGAILLQSNAKQLVAQYLQKRKGLVANHFFSNTIQDSDGGKLFCCAFWYPFECSKFGFEVGDYSPNSREAETACAFNVCKSLIAIGEIDPHLEVRGVSFIPEDCYKELNLQIRCLKEEEEELSKETALYEQVNSNYSQLIREPSSPNMKSLYFLYSVDFGQDSKLLGQADGEESLKFGILTSHLFDFKKFEIPLCVNQMEIKVVISYLTQHRFSPEMPQMKQIKFFTRHILKAVIVRESTSEGYLTSELDADDNDSFPSTNLFLTPLIDHNNEIDYEKIQKIQDWRKRFLEKFKRIKECGEVEPEVFRKPEDRSKMVLTYAHQRTIKFNTFGGAPAKNPVDEVSNGKTYKSYFKDRYNLDVDDELLHMDELAKTLRRRKIQTGRQTPKDENASNGHIFYSLKSAVIYPLTLPELLMYNSWNYINYRLEQYQRSSDLLKITHGMNNARVQDHFACALKAEYALPDAESYRAIDIGTIKKPDMGIEIAEEAIRDRSHEIGTVDRDRLFKIGSCMHNFGMATCLIENLSMPLPFYTNPPSKYSLQSDHFRLPDPSHILRAMTLQKAGDTFDNEQLEFVGDSFLKMTTCLYLYFKYPNFSEGHLTHLKSIMVSNENLFRLALKPGKELSKYIFSNILEMSKNWKPTFHQENVPSKQELKYKNIADCVESLMGTFLVHGSYDSLLEFFDWIGLKAFDRKTAPEDPVEQFQKKIQEMKKAADESPNTRWCVQHFDGFNVNELIDTEYKKFKLHEVEEIIGYSFKKRFYLVQAFTNSSYTTTLNGSSFKTNILGSNERLEFIGDGILDMLIALKIYEANESFRPVELSELKVALVNNSFFTSIVVKFGLHNYLRYSDTKIQTKIAEYVTFFKKAMHEQQCSMLQIPPETTTSITEPPKFLSDIFEALVGAIYLDNGFNLEELWKIVLHLIKPEFVYFLENIPKNPISIVANRYASRFQFEKRTLPVRKLEDEDSGDSGPQFGFKMALLIYPEKDCKGEPKEYLGYGAKSQLAKVSAAQQCLLDDALKAAATDSA